CLDHAARSFDAALGRASSDPIAALQGPRILDELPELECDTRDPPSSEAHREIDTALGEAAVLRAAGDHAAELDLLEATQVRARELEHPELLARVLAALADAQSRNAR